MLRYPATIAPDGPGFMASFRDIPEALTGATTREATLHMAADALVTALDFYFDDGRAIPAPSRARPGEVLVALPASVQAKVLLLNEMVSQGVSRAELARRLGTHKQEITRLVNLHHATKIDTLADALRALGRELDMRLC